MAAPTQCYYLDGTGDYVTGTDDAAWDITSATGLGMWICRDHDDLENVVLLDRANMIEFGYSAGHPYITVEGAGTLRANNVKLPKERPIMVSAVAYESGSDLYLELYVGEDQVATGTILSAAFPAATNTAIFVGSDSSAANALKGSVSSIFMTSDRVYHSELKTIFESSAGQATDVLDNLVIDVDTEGDLANAGTGTDPFTAGGNAVPRTYMNIFQSMAGTRVIHIPEAETKYVISHKILPTYLKWHGDTIADGDTLQLKDKNGKVLFTYVSILDDQGGIWYFDHDTCWDGLNISTLGHGLLEIGVR